MIKRTAFIGAILSLIPSSQPLIIKTGLVLSTTGLMLTVPEKVYARDNSYYFDLGNDKGKKGDHYGAILDFTKAIELDPKDADSYYNRGWNKSHLKDYYGAISDYTKAIEINPNDDAAFYNRGISKQKLKDYSGAISDYTKAIEINPKYFSAYYNRGNAKSDPKSYLKDYYGAISDYNQTIKINPNHIKAYVNRGRSFYFLNNKENACNDFKKSVSLGDASTEAWLNSAGGSWCREDYK